MFLCDECYNELVFLPEPISVQLSNCQLDQIIAATELNPPMRKIIHALKYQSVKDIGITLAKLLYFTTNLPAVDLITFVPLHKYRQQERGFNQAEVIAQELAKQLNTPCRQLLMRTVNSKHQARLEHKSDRLTHLENHFRLATEANIIDHKSIMIIDDVCTTGSTLNECAKVLKTAHAETVFGCTITHGV